MTEQTSKPIRFFSPKMRRVYNRQKFRLTTAELEGVSTAERALLEIVVDFYKAGSLMGIEDYSGGCSYPKSRLKQTLEKYVDSTASTHAGNSETFVFTMFFGDTEDFIKKRKIPMDSPNADPEETAAKYITEIAQQIPKSDAFFRTGKDDGVGFGFTLSGKAARAMHKINQGMNPHCRSAD